MKGGRRFHPSMTNIERTREQGAAVAAMTTRNYPKDRDLLWVASDARGQLATFTTGGSGPIPSFLLMEGRDIGSMEEKIFLLPEVTEQRLLVSMPRPDDFISFAKRGFFAYDYRDAHRQARKTTHRYELISVPAAPIFIDQLRGWLGQAATWVKLEKIEFQQCGELDVMALVECCSP